MTLALAPFTVIFTSPDVTDTKTRFIVLDAKKADWRSIRFEHVQGNTFIASGPGGLTNKDFRLACDMLAIQLERKVRLVCTVKEK